MSSDIAIRAEGLGKAYKIAHRAGGRTYRTLREDLIGILRAPFARASGANTKETIWALKDVSFTVKPGEALGIIGRNGAGKSTLLKILSRITRPTTGEADIYGRVGSLLEVGTGFHPELTGRENIFLSGAVLGMTRAEIQTRFDEIVEFSGIEKFIDTPVKRYSSGMYTRLAFSVAAHLETEILLIDEVLAVGDAAFQKKCLGKMSDVAGQGRTVLFVSHNMAAVQGLCQRGIVLHYGQACFVGNQADAIDYYTQSIISKESVISLQNRKDRKGSGEIHVVGVEFRDLEGQILDFVRSGQDIDIFLHYEAQTKRDVRNIGAGVNVYTSTGIPVFYQNTRVMGIEFDSAPPMGTIVCRIERLPLTPGIYEIRVLIKVNDQRVDDIDNAAQLHVIEGDYFETGQSLPEGTGVCLVMGQWRLE